MSVEMNIDTKPRCGDCVNFKTLNRWGTPYGEKTLNDGRVAIQGICTPPNIEGKRKDSTYALKFDQMPCEDPQGVYRRK